MPEGASAATINAARAAAGGDGDGDDDGDEEEEEEEEDGDGDEEEEEEEDGNGDEAEGGDDEDAFLTCAGINGNAVYLDAALACVLAFRHAADGVGRKRKAAGVVWSYSYTKAAAAFSAIFKRRFPATTASRSSIIQNVFFNNNYKRTQRTRK